MPIIPRKPFGDFDNFFEDDQWLMPLVPHTKLSQPAMDFYETDKEVIAELNLPDIDPEKVDISVENNILKISGQTEEKKEEKKKGYWKKEIRKGAFERIIRLPAPVKEDKIDATYGKGILKIVMPKSALEKSGKKRIKIKTK